MILKYRKMCFEWAATAERLFELGKKDVYEENGVIDAGTDHALQHDAHDGVCFRIGRSDGTN